MSGSDSSSITNKAYIQVLSSDGKVDEEIPVYFNPSEYNLDKTNEFSNIAVPRRESPFLQFNKGGLKTLTMNLFFDSFEDDEDVRDLTNQISDLLNVDSDINAPPVVRFVWGGPVLTGVISSLKQKFTLFSSEGVPLRATLTITLQEFQNDSSDFEEDKQIKTVDIYTIKQGDTLFMIADEYYNNPMKWRVIAKENDIVNPRTLEIGRMIFIPK